MDNEIFAIARVGLSVDVTATIEDDSCVIGISMTFKIDLIIFAGLPAPSERTVLRAPTLKTNAKEYLQDKALKLKAIYSDWESYLNNYQNKISGTVFKSMADVEKRMKEIVLEQVAVRGRIEEIIGEVYSEFKTANLNVDDTEATLKFLSNCYQLIRDLSLSFTLGKQTLELNIEPTDGAESIRKELLKNYSKNKIMEKIKKRRTISEAIISKREEVSELKATFFDYEDKLFAADEQNSAAMKKVECRKASMSLVKKAIEEWNALEMSSLKTRLDILNSEIAEYEKKIAELSADKGLFSKKKSQLVIDEINKFLSAARQERDALEKQINSCKYSTTEDQFAYISEAKLEGNSELTKMSKEMNAIKEKMVKLKAEIEKLLAEYETIVKEFA